MPPETKRQRNRLLTNLYYVLLGAIFVIAAVKRFAGLPLEPFADKDLGGYLSPDLSALAGHGFVLSNGRGFPYPAFVFWILRLAGGDFRAVPVVQHLMGLATGGLLVASWNRARAFANPPATPLVVHEVLGLVLAASYLLFNWPILYEHRIRPEAIFPFFIAVNIFANVEFIRRRFLLPEKNASFVLGIVIVFSAGLLYMLKPAWGFSVLFSSLPVWVALVTGKEAFWKRLLLGATPAFLVVALLLLPEKILERTDSLSEVFLPRLLFAMHANLIRDQMRDDLANHAAVPYDAAWLASTADSLSAEIDKSKPDRQPTLGFDPDYLIYKKGSSCDQIATHFAGHPHDLAGFFIYYYLRTAERKPFAMAVKVLRQMGVFYSFNSAMYRAGPLDIAEEYRNSVSVLNGSVSSSPLVTDWRARCQELGAHAAPLSNGRFETFMIHLLRYTHVILLVVGVLLPVVVILSGSLRASLLGLALLDLLIYSYSFGNNLTVAIVHTMEVNRYVQNEFAFVLFLHFVTVLLVVEVCLRRFGKEKGVI